MARKNPVGKLAETALSTLKDPKGTAGKVVGQARTTVAFGRALGNTAGAVAGHAAGKVSERVSGGRRPQARPGTESAGRSQEQPTARGGLRAVPEVNEPAATQPPRTSRGTSDSPKAHGDALASTKKTPGARKSTAKKAPAKKAAGAKAAGAKAPAKKAPAKKAPAGEPAATKKSAASPADVAEVVESKVAEDPKKTAAKPAKKAPAKKSSTKKATAKKSSPSGKLPAKKSQRAEPAAERQGSADEARPKSAAEVAAEVAAVEGEDVRTPAGTSAAERGSNPDTGDTGLTQPGTDEVVDPATAKQVSSETQKLRKAAEKNPE